MSDKENAESNKRSFAPITTLMCILSGTFLIMLFMLFSLYNKALNGIIEGKIPIDKLDIKMTDAFIGIIATLIGIMVTFVIGYQILNAIQIKTDVEKYQNETETQIKNQNNAFGKFKIELKNISLVNRMYELQKAIEEIIAKLDNLKPLVKPDTSSDYYTQYLISYYEYFNALYEYSKIVNKVDEIYLYKDFEYESVENILTKATLLDFEIRVGFFSKNNINIERRIFFFIGISNNKSRMGDSIKHYCDEIQNELYKRFPNYRL